MRLLRVLRLRVRSLFHGARVERELDWELAFHLEQLARENIASGMTAGDALRAARRALGGEAQIGEQCRDQRRIGWLVDLHKDIVYAWRMLRKSPGFTALAVLTLALGAGASIAVYTLGESLLLRSLPYPSPERLVAVYSVHERRGSSQSVGEENFRDWRAANTVFERMAYTEFSQMSLTGLGDTESVTGRSVSEGFFELLGVPPQLGRWFTPEEHRTGAERVVMLSHGFWVRKLGARPDVVGERIFLDERPYHITGVMPESFRFNEGRISEYWTPFAYHGYGRQQHQYTAYARLKPGVSVRAAQAQMSEIARRQEKDFPDNAGWGVRVAGLRGEILKTLGPALALFAAAALIVMLVGSANVASLLLARGVGRGKEIAVRIALGARRGRVVRLLLTESLLLSCLGALTGLALAALLIRAAIALAPPWLRLEAMVSVSPASVAFVIVLSLCTGVLTGIWPALGGSRANLQHDLKESGSGLVAGRQQQRALDGLVVAEITLAVVLLTFAGLLGKSVASVLHRDLGYRADHLLTFRISSRAPRYRDKAARLQFWSTLLPKLAALPGVVSAAASNGIPLGGTYNGTDVLVEGQVPPRDWTEQTCRTSPVTPGYFRTMGIPLRAGRDFTALDTAKSEPVVVVNQAFARKLLGGADPIGKRVNFGDGKWERIVGVVGDHLYRGPSQPAEAEAYLASAQEPWLQFVVLRTAVPESVLIGAVSKAIQEVDARMPMTQVRTMQEAIDVDTSLQREMAAVVTSFAAITLGMAVLGLAGVMAYVVSRRRREIGLRLALGACSADISRAVMRSAARLVLAGSVIGACCALAGSRLLESLLYGVRPYDPAVILAAPLVLGGIALAACLVPARRAASVDPMAALRQE